MAPSTTTTTGTAAPAAAPAKPRKARAAKPTPWGCKHPMALALLRALPKAAYVVGAHGVPGAAPNAKGEILVKLPGHGTVAYVSLAAKGTALHAVRSTTGLRVTGTPAAVAKATVAKAKAAAANRR